MSSELPSSAEQTPPSTTTAPAQSVANPPSSTPPTSTKTPTPTSNPFGSPIPQKKKATKAPKVQSIQPKPNKPSSSPPPTSSATSAKPKTNPTPPKPSTKLSPSPPTSVSPKQQPRPTPAKPTMNKASARLPLTNPLSSPSGSGAKAVKSLKLTSSPPKNNNKNKITDPLLDNERVNMIKADAESKENELQIKLEQEAERARLLEIKRIHGNGNVKLIYERYSEMFSIVDGSCTALSIDDEYCLSFAMPNVILKLSKLAPKERTKYIQDNGDDAEVLMYEVEEPVGVYRGLNKDIEYYVVPIQCEDQKRLDEKTQALRISYYKEEKVEKGFEYDRVEMQGHCETCSCVEGNPCIDEYVCKNWAMRYVISKEFGWPGFPGY